MDILTVLRTIIRRWLVVVPIILITAATAFSVGSSIKPEYGMAGTVLLASQSGAVPVNSDAAAVVTTPVLAEILRSAAVNRRMVEAGAVSPYVVEVDPSTSILRITAAGRDGPTNIRSVEVILDNLDEELRLLERTAEVPEGSRASVKLLARPSDQPGAGLPSASGSAFLVATRLAETNPYAANSYTTRILTELMLAAESRRRVFDRAGGVATFSLTAEPRDAAPVLSISVRGLDPRITEAVYESVVAVTSQLLDEKQSEAGVEVRSRTRLSQLNVPAGATKTSGTVVKSVGTVVGLGLIAAATAAILLESLLAGRADRPARGSGRRRRSAVIESRVTEAPPVADAGDTVDKVAVEAESPTAVVGAPRGRQKKESRRAPRKTSTVDEARTGAVEEAPLEKRADDPESDPAPRTRRRRSDSVLERPTTPTGTEAPPEADEVAGLAENADGAEPVPAAIAAPRTKRRPADSGLLRLPNVIEIESNEPAVVVPSDDPDTGFPIDDRASRRPHRGRKGPPDPEPTALQDAPEAVIAPDAISDDPHPAISDSGRRSIDSGPPTEAEPGEEVEPNGALPGPAIPEARPATSPRRRRRDAGVERDKYPPSADDASEADSPSKRG